MVIPRFLFFRKIPNVIVYNFASQRIFVAFAAPLCETIERLPVGLNCFLGSSLKSLKLKKLFDWIPDFNRATTIVFTPVQKRKFLVFHRYIRLHSNNFLRAVPVNSDQIYWNSDKFCEQIFASTHRPKSSKTLPRQHRVHLQSLRLHGQHVQSQTDQQWIYSDGRWQIADWK